MADANVYDGGCKRLRWRLQTFAVKRGSALQGRMQCTAGTVAVHCRGGCSALRLRWVKLALKSSSPILDRRKGRKDSPHMGHSSPQEISAEPDKGDVSTESDNTRVSTIMIDVSKHFVEPRRLLLEITCGFEVSSLILYVYYYQELIKGGN